MRRKAALLIAVIMILTVLTACGHKHTPSAPATCTEPQVCTDCGEVLVEALGHEPGAPATCTEPQTCTRCGYVFEEAKGHVPGNPATCTEPQVCTVCGEVIVPAKGHNVGESGVCIVCGERIVPEGQTFIPAGNHGTASDDISGIIAETQNSGHYSNNINAYYAGNVLVCGNYGLEYFLPDANGDSGWADIVNKFAAKYPSVSVTALLAPKSCVFNFPEGYTDPYDRTKSYIDSTYGMLDSGIKTADCLGEMEAHEGEYMFYRTDHHWTSLGAYYASAAYCKANGIEPKTLDSYETVVKTGFIGTLYGYAGNDSNLKAMPDYTVGHYPQTGYSMVYKNGGSWFGGKAINGLQNTYAGMFIGGDQPLSVFTTENKNGKNLIIFKESYGNAFVPYMIDYYETVVVVDIRMESESVESIVEKYNITDALIINNCQAAVSLQSELRAKALS